MTRPGENDELSHWDYLAEELGLESPPKAAPKPPEKVEEEPPPPVHSWDESQGLDDEPGEAFVFDAEVVVGDDEIVEGEAEHLSEESIFGGGSLFEEEVVIEEVIVEEEEDPFEGHPSLRAGGGGAPRR